MGRRADDGQVYGRLAMWMREIVTTHDCAALGRDRHDYPPDRWADAA